MINEKFEMIFLIFVYTIMMKEIENAEGPFSHDAGHLCNLTSGTCECRNEYTGPMCERCDTSWYKDGSRCLQCPGNCKSCTGYNTCTSCKSGFYGHSCCLRCPSSCKLDLCNKDNGTCTQGCRSGFYGPKCTKCPQRCLKGECDGIDGTCACETGYTGVRCEQCKRGWFKYRDFCRKCPYNCETCTCDTDCQSCKPGFYGNKCDTLCSFGCQEKSCDIMDGTCTSGCSPGYYRYGKICIPCSRNCKADKCDSEYGTCECKYGYTGDYCESCLTGWYRQHNVNCKQCPDSCTSCNASNWCHSCKPGLYGYICKRNCSSSCLEQLCDIRRGTCTKGCARGYFGATCKKCSNGCTNGYCNEECGSCQCKPGYTGDACDHCLTGWYEHNGECAECPVNCKSCLSFSNCLSCIQGHYGRACYMKSSSHIDITTVVCVSIAVVGVAFVIGMVSGSVVLYRRYRRHERDQPTQVNSNEPVVDESIENGSMTTGVNQYEGLISEDQFSPETLYENLMQENAVIDRGAVHQYTSKKLL